MAFVGPNQTTERTYQMASTTDLTKITTSCPLCAKSDIIAVPTQGHRNWTNGAYIQDALPDLTADQREQFISGVCPPCWGTFNEPEIS